MTGETFENELSGKPVYYDFRTIHDRIYGGENGYICSKEEVMDEIRKFVTAYGK